MTRLLIAEVDVGLACGIQRVLERRGLAVEWVSDGRALLNQLQLGLADVCLLGADLETLDGLTVLRRARALGVMTPVLVMAAADTTAARLTWFEAGADDIVGRPFDLDELVARMQALQRRAERRITPSVLQCGPLSFDPPSASFLLRGQLFKLTPKEHGFLRTLIARPGLMVPRDSLIRALFETTVGLGAIDVLACRVRRKLAGSGVTVSTIRGLGYVLQEQARSLDMGADARLQKYTRSASSVPMPLRSVATAPDAV